MQSPEIEKVSHTSFLDLCAGEERHSPLSVYMGDSYFLPLRRVGRCTGNTRPLSTVAALYALWALESWSTIFMPNPLLQSLNCL